MLVLKNYNIKKNLRFGLYSLNNPPKPQIFSFKYVFIVRFETNQILKYRFYILEEPNLGEQICNLKYKRYSV